MLDLTGVDASTEFKGDYPFRVTKVTEKTSQNDNKYLAMELTVFGDKHKGRKILESFVFSNSIAKQRLAQLVDAAGMDRKITDWQDFVNKEVLCKVVPNKDDEYSKISKFSKYAKPTDFPV